MIPHNLTGKGAVIWQPWNIAGGSPERTAEMAVAAGLTYVLVKIADVQYAFGYSKTTKTDMVPPLVAALKARGLKVWGWHYVKGDDPVGEAKIAIERVAALGLDGYVIDAEKEYKVPIKALAAKRYMNTLRAGLPNTPIALCSYRYPRLHRELPWAVFLEQCDLNMPQVYWEQAHNPAQQLQWCVEQFNNKQLVSHIRPVVPMGSAYGAGGWRATPADIAQFLDKAQALGLPSANLYTMDWATSAGNTDLWTAIANYNWPLPVTERVISALVKQAGRPDYWLPLERLDTLTDDIYRGAAGDKWTVELVEQSKIR